MSLSQSGPPQSRLPEQVQGATRERHYSYRIEQSYIRMGLWIIIAWVSLAFVAACSANNAFVTVAPKPKNHAWWLRAQYHPFGSSLRGIPLYKIRENWCRANEFSRDLFPPKMLLDHGEDILTRGGTAFSISGKFDDTNLLTALVGVYETCAKEKGTFLLILKSPESSGPTGGSPIVFLAEFPRHMRFATLRPSPDNVLNASPRTSLGKSIPLGSEFHC